MKLKSLVLTFLLSIATSALQAQTSLDLTDYELVFSDEFDTAYPTTVVDPEKWSSRFYWGPYVTINAEEQLYVDTLGINSDFAHTPFSISNGVLTIEAIPTTSVQAPDQPSADSSFFSNSPDLSHQPDYNPDDINYLSGLLATTDSYNATHGYFEARLKFPAGQGLWPAFWLLNKTYVENSPEIDIVEFLGHKIDTVHHTMHYINQADDYRTVSSPTFETIGPDYTANFHTYGVAWDPKRIRFFVDGEMVKEITDEEFLISSQSMYLILNLAVGGSWPGSPNNSTVFPAKFDIDYVRAYERKSQPVINQQILDDEYDLMFSDEFNGNSLDANVWNSAFLWGPYLQINNEEQVYIDKLGLHQDHPVNPFELSSGTLKIKAAKIVESNLPQIPDLADPVWKEFASYQQQTNYLEEGGWTPQFSSGILTTYDEFKFVNGYAEARLKMPVGSGLWPAFWLLNGYYVGPSPEMDIVEVRGSEPLETHHSYHYQNTIGALESSAVIYDLPTSDVSEFHTYGFQWDRNRMVWYVDGVAVRELISSDVSQQLSYVILNLAVGGNFVNEVDENSLPSQLEVDYVRVYQTKSAPLLSSTPSLHDFELVLNEIEEGEYGWRWGSNANIESVFVEFERAGEDIELSVTGYDIDYNNEVAVFLNGAQLGYLRRGSNNQLNAGDVFTISAEVQLAENELEFRQVRSLGYIWGITDVSIRPMAELSSYDFELALNEIEEGEYGWRWGSNANIESVFVEFESAGEDIELSVTGYDIDYNNEVAVFLNGAQLGYLRRGSNNQLNAGDVFTISAEVQLAENELEFRQVRSLGYIWGVTNVSIVAQ